MSFSDDSAEPENARAAARSEADICAAVRTEERRGRIGRTGVTCVRSVADHRRAPTHLRPLAARSRSWPPWRRRVGCPQQMGQLLAHSWASLPFLRWRKAWHRSHPAEFLPWTSSRRMASQTRRRRTDVDGTLTASSGSALCNTQYCRSAKIAGAAWMESIFTTKL